MPSSSSRASSPDARDLRDQRLQTVCLMTTQMTDAEHTGRSIGKRQYRRERRRDLPCRGQVEITKTMHMAVATHLAIPHAVLFGERDARAHAFQISRQQSTGWVVSAGQCGTRTVLRRSKPRRGTAPHSTGQVRRPRVPAAATRHGRLARRETPHQRSHCRSRRSHQRRSCGYAAGSASSPPYAATPAHRQARPDQQQTGDEL